MCDLARFVVEFTALTGNAPFPWQEKMYKRIVSGDFPRSCDLPTGLGKTSVIAIWFIALAHNPGRVPCRLVYIVNRRTVVDQATDEAERLRDRLNGKGELSAEDRAVMEQLRKTLARLAGGNHDEVLAISTLRGQFADNAEWRADPARPAVIVGTVDMIGSRLLFSGYGLAFKSRPLHAGFLGQDALIVHDEAHLEPTFHKLLVAIGKEQERCKEFGAIHVMALSATSRGGEEPFELTKEEKNPPDHIPDPPTEPIHHVWRRLTAKKGLKPVEVKRDEIAKKIGETARRWKSEGKAILVFVRTIDDVRTVQRVLTDKKEGVPDDQVQLLTGTLRGLERDQLVREDPIYARFLLKAPPDGKAAYLICTSAGEVGIDISADHMVCDLTTLESMAQRLGRVNRRGDGQAEIEVVYEGKPDPKPKDKDLENARWKTLAILRQLRKCDWDDTRHDASPLGLRKLSLSTEDRTAAFAPEPKELLTSDILFDVWALTTIRKKLPGRPPVADYLHGIQPWEPPETHVVWREEVERITGDLLEKYNPQDLLEDYPLKPHELLHDRTYRVAKELEKLVERLAKASPSKELVAWVVDDDGTVEVNPLPRLVEKDKQKRPVVNLAGRTVVLPPSAGGLSQRGMLSGESAFTDERQGDFDVADEWYEDADRKNRRRVRVWDDDPEFNTKTKRMRLVRSRIDLRPDVEEEAEEELIGHRYWYWYELPRAADTEGSKSANERVRWQVHTDDVVREAGNILNHLPLPDEVKQAIMLAAKWHDLGKKRELWQRSIGNPNPTDWHAKSGKDPETGKRWTLRDICPDFRHEFGSLLDVLDPQQPFLAELRKLPADMQELVLHLIAAHHGRARPQFPVDPTRDPPLDEAFDPRPPKGSNVNALAAEVPRRFARLQRKYGRWGLAYLESLLRAADWAASAKPSATVEEKEGQS